MMNDIRDVKPPVDIPGHWEWLWFVFAGVIFLFIVGYLVCWFLKRPRLTKEVELPKVSSWEKAYARLENLRSKKLMERPYLKPFYTELSSIIRRYLEERFTIKAPEMTTEEFLNSLKHSPILNESQQQILKEFLFTCDMVKFAKHESTLLEAQKSFDLAKQLVEETHGI
jgi:hypothetical protein